MPIVPEGYGQDGGGRGGTIGDYQGHFTATTVKQRAFDANDYILFDNGSKLDVFLAPVDIPINSPAPGESMSLWGGLIAQITSGVSRADFDSALARKANAASLANYLRTATYNLDKARIESGITGNDNDISALMTALDTLQTQVNNLPSGGGEGGGGDVTTEALNKAINDLRTALEASINQKQDADTAATDAELADSVSTLQRNINTLSTRIGNIPVSAEVLWATSKQLPTRLPRAIVDTDWTLAADVPTGVTVDGDKIDMPEGFRGDLHVDLEDTAGNLIQRRILPIQIGNVNFSTPISNRLRVRIAQNTTDATKVRFYLEATQGVTLPSAAVIKIYSVSALPRSQVAGITQEELINALVPTSVAVFPKKIAPTKAALTTTLILELGKVFPPITTANRLIVSFQGSVIYNGVIAGGFTDDMVIPLPITAQQADNIATNTNAQWTTYDVNVSFKLNNEDATLASRRLKIVIDRS